MTFQHIDMTPEYNRIIVALTGIRDDIRLLRTLQEDPESGIVTSNVLNDFQRALLAVSMSSAVGATAGAVAAAIDSGATPNGSGIAAPTGDSAGDLQAERAAILEALGQDPTELKVLIRTADGNYYWEADPIESDDDGDRGTVAQVIPFALGAQLGYHSTVTDTPTAGASPGESDFPLPTKGKKRWTFVRPEGSTALTSANPNSDLVDPATGQVVAKSFEAQTADDLSPNTSPPAINYEE